MCFTLFDIGLLACLIRDIIERSIVGWWWDSGMRKGGVEIAGDICTFGGFVIGSRLEVEGCAATMMYNTPLFIF